MKTFKVIGARLPRVDAVEKVTGRAVFGADFSLPGMLFSRVLRSPYAHATIKKIDVGKALALPGVKAIVTGDDLPRLEPGCSTPMGELDIDSIYLSQVVMAREKVVFHAQPVAAVAALDPFIAEEALSLIEVEYEELPVVLDVLQAMRPDAPLLHPDLYTETLGEKPKKPSNVATHVELSRGDVEKGFAEADVIIEDTYRTQMVHQGYIEPQASLAKVDQDGKVTVWTTTQGSFSVKIQLAELLQLPLSQIRVVPLEIGGGFGGKINVILEPLCVLLARKSGRPVKMVLTREEVLRATGPGSPAVITLKTGAKRDGTLTAVLATMIYDAGAFPGSPVSAGLVAGLGPYKVLNLKLTGYDVVTNKPRVQAYRSPGAPQAAFAVETQMDRMAEVLGIDPLTFRMKNAVETGDKLPNDRVLPRIGLKTLLDQVATHPAWMSPLEGLNRGRGLAVGYWGGGSLISSAQVLVNPDGSIAVVIGVVDLTGTRTTMVQVAAEEFGVKPEEVTITVTDTETAPYSDVSAGSRVARTLSAAVHRACRDALAKLKERAAARLNVQPRSLEYVDRTFRVRKDPTKAISLRELAQDSASGKELPVVGEGSVSRMKPAPAFAAHIVDVEVDPETGKVKLLRYTAFQDVGRALNPTEVEGQMQGGAAQGIGWALTEGYLFENGAMRNATLLDYRMPTALDLPMIDCVLVEVPSEDNPYGARGVGEVPIVPPPAALANAIYRAVGVRLTELPMTPEAVFWAIKDRGVRAGG